MLHKLQEMKIKAMKEKDAIGKSILSVLHSESLVLAKNENRDVQDNDIIKSAKSLIKKNEQVLYDLTSFNLLSSNTIKMKQATQESYILQENEILKTFLPKQLTEDEIKKEIDAICTCIPPDELIRKNQGKIMKILKDKFGEGINMGIASKYVGTKLTLQ